MRPSFLQLALRRALTQVRHVQVVPPNAASGLVGEVYGQVERDFGMLAPPVALHSAAPGPLVGSWLMLRETLLADGIASRAAKEAVAAAVSLANACPYCVDVHGSVLAGLVTRADAESVAGDGIDSVTDPGLRSIARWARESASAGTGRPPPVPDDQAPELTGVAVTFHYLNRMVAIFLGDSPLPPEVPAMARNYARRTVGRLLLGRADRSLRPGGSLGLLPAAPEPADIRAWAGGHRVLAGAFARTNAAIEEAGRDAVPPSVRDLVLGELDEWTGGAPGISRSWLEPRVAGLPERDRPAGRLALLTALAAYQIDEPVIAEFRRDRPGDDVLLGLTSWASLAAARRVGSWLSPVRQARQEHS
ncbi:carboxymuconolactone decarboxylase family protein [Amycolatopsis anabasis]|uniref:carboxymuconolactone decarboxylase family protein n=1 Tax=Amycolatopsis anabasis TaxID=1840409 RepID=UPI00131D3CFE|nr:carboxymuconolactone decarboxylase family protein [Amycolatopsis anabasis]